MATKILREGTNVAYHVKWTAEEGARFESQVPERDEVAALLHRIRPFLLKNEPAYFPRIANLLSRHLDDPTMREYIGKARSMFSANSTQDQARIMSNNVVLNSEAVLMQWLNSYEYHRDEDKRAALDDLHKLAPLESSVALFVMILIEKAKAIWVLADLVALLDDDGERFVRF
jgi:hypothetical protein